MGQICNKEPQSENASQKCAKDASNTTVTPPLGMGRWVGAAGQPRGGGEVRLGRLGPAGREEETP